MGAKEIIVIIITSMLFCLWIFPAVLIGCKVEIFSADGLVWWYASIVCLSGLWGFKVGDHYL